MADFVCRCGTYIRAYVPPGTKVACTHCGAILTMGRVDEDSYGSSSGSSQPSSQLRSKGNYKLFLIAGSLLSAAILCGGSWWLWSRQSKPPIQQPNLQRIQPPATESERIIKPEPNQQAKWSNIQDWVPATELKTQGSEILSLTKNIIDRRPLAFSSGFWDPLVLPLNPKTANAPNKAELEAFLKTSGLEMFTSREGVICDHWSALAAHSDQNNPCVLIRYFREPIDPTPSQPSNWINLCQSIVTLDEFAQTTQAVFQEPSNTIDETPGDPTGKLYLTPSFGYLILVFQNEADKILWKDLIPLPGEVPLSDAVNPKSDHSLNHIDVFGQYQADMDKPLSAGLFFDNGSEPPLLPSQTRKIIASISAPRARRLAEIAESATVDTSNLDARMARFRKEFPNDLGGDALLISIWCTKYYAKRSSESYDDSGRIYIDAAHRLFMKTSDPLLLELKSRIYQAYGRRQDAEKSLVQAEQAGHKSLGLLEQRLTEAAEAKDKEKLLDYLGKLNAFVQSLPKSAISPRIQSQWNQQLEDWKSRNKTQ